MKFRFGIFVCLGLLLVAAGMLQWMSRRGPALVVARFIQALRDGDRNAALQLLDPEQQVEARLQFEKQDTPWEPAPDLTYRTQQLTFDGDEAKMRMLLFDGGYKLHPVFLLRRNTAGEWRILAIENLHPDPKWEQIEEERTERARQRCLEDDARLADQLSRALQDVPGVIVHREDEPVRR